MRRRIPVLAAFTLLAAGQAEAIVLQYSGGSPFQWLPAVVKLNSGCTGALLADGMHIVTAAHCAATFSQSGPDTVYSAYSWLQAFVATPTEQVQIPVSAVHINPLAELMFPTDPSAGLLVYDLAVLDLASPAPADGNGYTIDASGQAIVNHSAVTLAGWGLSGYPGAVISGASAGSRRWAVNNVAGIISEIDDPSATPSSIVPPDLPIEVDWTTTSDTNNPNNLTGLGDFGDSGSPLIYNGQLIGILAYGDLPGAGGTVQIGQTYVNGYMNLAVAGNYDFIQDVVNAPEPATWAMLGAGLLAGLARRRRIAR